MDFQFNHLYGKVFTQCSMGYEAFAHWFNIEMPLNPTFSQGIEQALAHFQSSLAQDNFSFIGKEYSLYLTVEEAVVKGNFLQEENEIFPDEDLHLYQDESIACCGREDFAHLFYAYLAFSQGK